MAMMAMMAMMTMMTMMVLVSSKRCDRYLVPAVQRSPPGFYPQMLQLYPHHHHHLIQHQHHHHHYNHHNHHHHNYLYQYSALSENCILARPRHIGALQYVSFVVLLAPTGALYVMVCLSISGNFLRC